MRMFEVVEMKQLLMLAMLMFGSTLSAAPPNGWQHNFARHDYHDYVNSNIQSKSFIRYQSNGSVYDETWHFDRPDAGLVVRTEIATDPGGVVYACRINKFMAMPEAFKWIENTVCDGNVVPPLPIFTNTYDPPVVLFTDKMIPGVAWGTGGVIQQSSSPDNFYTDRNEILSVEDVTVPAGTYSNCLKIYKLRDYANAYTRIEWICPNVGLVKRVHAGNRLMELTGVTYESP